MANEVVVNRLRELTASGRYRDLLAADRDLAASEGATVLLHVRGVSSRLGEAAQALYDVDVDLRRVAAFRSAGFLENPELLRGERGGLAALPRPLPHSQAGLEIRSAAAGSLDVLVVPLGALVDLLSSHPITALANLVALREGAGRIRAFLGRRQVPLANLTGEQVIAVLRALEGDPTSALGGPPDHSAEVGQAPFLTHRRSGAEMTLSDGSVVRARQITLVRTHPDGTSDHIIAN